MRFGILSQYYPPEVGAPQARLSELADRFVRRGHEVHVLTAMPNYPQGRVHDGYGGLLRREELGGARVVRSYVYPTKRAGMVPRLTSYFSFVGSSMAAGAATLPRLDYLLTESPPLFIGIAGYALSRLKRARWIFNVSDLWPESAVNLGVVRAGPGLRAAEALEAFCYREAWLVSGQSREILGSVERRFPGTHTYHLSNGVDVDRFGGRPGSAEARRELLAGFTDADGGPPPCLAVYAGLHGLAQGLEQLVDAATWLRDGRGAAGGRVLFAFVGDGPEKERLVAIARERRLDNVRFLDAMPRDRMPDVVAAADVALVPLKHHIPGAVPSKIYEAMASARPILLVAEGEPAAIVRDNGAGRVVAPGDGPALVAALAALARDPDARRRLGDAGRRAAEERFNRDTIAERFIAYLEAGERAASSHPAAIPSAPF